MKKKITPAEIKALARAAVAAKKFSYSPYSHFKVGAAVLSDKGRIYTGTNIENSSYGLTVCAERNAIFKAVGDGHRHLRALAVCTDALSGQEFGTPCGACRQVMSEFMDPQDTVILVAQTPRGVKTAVYQVADFMPHPFPKLYA